MRYMFRRTTASVEAGHYRSDKQHRRQTSTRCQQGWGAMMTGIRTQAQGPRRESSSPPGVAANAQTTLNGREFGSRHTRRYHGAQTKSTIPRGYVLACIRLRLLNAPFVIRKVLPTFYHDNNRVVSDNALVVIPETNVPCKHT